MWIMIHLQQKIKKCWPYCKVVHKQHSRLSVLRADFTVKSYYLSWNAYFSYNYYYYYFVLRIRPDQVISVVLYHRRNVIYLSGSLVKHSPPLWPKLWLLQMFVLQEWHGPKLWHLQMFVLHKRRGPKLRLLQMLVLIKVCV